MKKIWFFTIFVASIFLVPNLGSAECTAIGSFNSFALEGYNTVVLYIGTMPVIRFDLQNCEINPGSVIRVLQTNVCDGDEIEIDGVNCTMMEIKPLGP